MTVIKGYNSGTSAWEPVAVGADITNTLTTKGDLLGRSSSAAARLGVGANGTVLTADSAETTGLKWAAPAASGASWTQLGVSATTSGSTVTISGLSGYNQLYVQLEFVSVDAGIKEFYLRMNADNTTKYNTANFSIRNAASVSSGYYSAAGTEIYLGRTANAGNTFVGGILINGANSTGKKFYQGFFASVTDLVNSDITQPNFTGTYDGTSVISSVSLVTNSTAFDGGNIRVFGSVA
jgi:hypothetical protein